MHKAPTVLPSVTTSSMCLCPVTMRNHMLMLWVWVRSSGRNIVQVGRTGDSLLSMFSCMLWEGGGVDRKHTVCTLLKLLKILNGPKKSLVWSKYKRNHVMPK